MTLATAPGEVMLRAGAQRLSPAALALVLLAHGGLLAGLLAMQGAPMPVPPSTVMVALFQAPVLAPKATAVAPTKPVDTPTRTPQPAPLRQSQPSVATTLFATDSAQTTASNETARSENAAAAQAPAALAPPYSASADSGPASSKATGPATPAAAPATAPRFDAAYLDNPAPVYPPLSRRAGEEGRVLLHVLVEASGVAAQVEVRSSSGFERLDRAAQAAVRRWKFVPARQGGEAVAAWVLVPIVFGLKG